MTFNIPLNAQVGFLAKYHGSHWPGPPAASSGWDCETTNRESKAVRMVIVDVSSHAFVTGESPKARKSRRPC